MSKNELIRYGILSKFVRILYAIVYICVGILLTHLVSEWFKNL